MPNRLWTYRSMVSAAHLRRLARLVRGSQRAALLGILLASQVATAEPTFTVNSFLDQQDDLSTPGTCHTAANTCTLRAAIMQANRTSGVGATVVLPAGLYTLTIPGSGADGEDIGDLNLTTPAVGNPVISILGAGAATTLIDGNQLDRVFYVEGGRTASISGITIRNGFLPIGSGGGIFNDGSLTLTNATISGNSAVKGGGILDRHALTVIASTIVQNTAILSGGGIQSYGDLNVRGSTVSGNRAGEDGGGIFGEGSSVFVRNSTIQGNSSDRYGGGIFATGLTLLNSTVSGNQAAFHAGGIVTVGSTLLLSSTISQNSTNGNGGGVYNTGTANVYSTTIAFNGADVDGDGVGAGGGVYNPNGATFNLRNTLVAGNNTRAPFFGYLDDCSGILTGFGANLFKAVLVSSGCIVNGSWGTLNFLTTLGPLQDNGGPTWTHALLPFSNAIDGSTGSGCVDNNSVPLPTDQRGAPRVTGLRCDIGAFEAPEPGLALMLGCGALGLAGMGRRRRGAGAHGMS